MTGADMSFIEFVARTLGVFIVRTIFLLPLGVALLGLLGVTAWVIDWGYKKYHSGGNA